MISSPSAPDHISWRKLKADSTNYTLTPVIVQPTRCFALQTPLSLDYQKFVPHGICWTGADTRLLIVFRATVSSARPQPFIQDASELDGTNGDQGLFL